jgi:hypothetical protein
LRACSISYGRGAADLKAAIDVTVPVSAAVTVKPTGSLHILKCGFFLQDSLVMPKIFCSH